MRRCFITERQLKYIKENNCYLDKTDNGTDVPTDSNVFNGGEVAAKATDSDEVVTTDKIAHSRVTAYPWHRRGYGLSEDLDNDKAYIGKKSQEYLSQMNGKMANNISKEMQNGGSRLNTTEVRLNRLEKQKKNDPNTFFQNGGERTIKALKSIKDRQRNSAKVLSQTGPRYNTSLSADFNHGFQTPDNKQKGSKPQATYDFNND